MLVRGWCRRNDATGKSLTKTPGLRADFMLLSSLKNWLIDDRTRPVRILRGPFRGATICMSLRENLRKVLGIYEHELNAWIVGALQEVDTVLDIGANDGYFTFGCGAVFKRAGRTGRIVAFEPQAIHCEQLRATMDLQATNPAITISVERTLVSNEVSDGQTTLDALVHRPGSPLMPRRTLVKIDVEGAEVDVIAGASLWLERSNRFLIEVHHESYLEILQNRFAAAGIPLVQITQRPLPLLGREHRQTSNWWLVSPLTKG